MALRVGLMGFGRIGRNLFRILHTRDDIRVAGISDIADPHNLEYLLKYDTILGRFPHSVSVTEGCLYTYGRQIDMFSGAEPGDVPWGDLGVDVVVEATGKRRSMASLRRHLEAGAKKVILCAPPTDEPDITVLYGINHTDLRADHEIISNGSITAHCAAPLLRSVNDAFGVKRAFLSSVHAYTNHQNLADVPAAELRQSRAAAENIIPSQSGTAKLLEQVMPEFAGKLSQMVLNVPVSNGSLVDLVVATERPTSAGAVNEVIRTATDAHYQGLVEYAVDPIVSSDVKQSPYSCTFDSLATSVLGGQLVKTISWYDNGFGYAHRVVDVMQYLSKRGMLS